MSNEKAKAVPSPSDSLPRPAFLSVKTGDFVIVEAQPVGAMEKTGDWWMGQVVFCEGGARNPEMNSLFQIADVDDGAIRWVCADEVTHIVPGLKDSFSDEGWVNRQSSTLVAQSSVSKVDRLH